MSDFDELIDNILFAIEASYGYASEPTKEYQDARGALNDAISAVTSERDNLASRVRELARIISDDGTPDEDLYQSLTEGLPEVAK